MSRHILASTMMTCNLHGLESQHGQNALGRRKLLQQHCLPKLDLKAHTYNIVPTGMHVELELLQS